MKNFYANLFVFLLLWVASLGIVFYKPVNLGLDLRGGVSILLQPDLSYALEQEYQRMSKDLYDKLREEKAPVLDVLASKEGIKVELLEDAKIEQVIQKHFPRLEIRERGKGYVLLALKEQEISALREGTVSQTIEVLRKRIDELGWFNQLLPRWGRIGFWWNCPVFWIWKGQSLL
jgi:preprotein translocase subunit SecD